MDMLNIGDLTKPATVLVEKVCNAVGILYEPTRIISKARAEAQAAAIMAHSALDITEIEQRGLERLIRQEGRKQGNIESITMQAAALVSPDANPTDMSEDWIADVFSKCENVSDAEMQVMWARLLAGEADSPGSFSKRTVEVVSLLDKVDAYIFNEFCQFVWVREIDSFPFISSWSLPILHKFGFDTSTRVRLAEAGLLSQTSTNVYALPAMAWKDARARVVYPKISVCFTGMSTETAQVTSVGEGILTRAGREIFRISSPAHNEEYPLHSLQFWKEGGLGLSIAEE